MAHTHNIYDTDNHFKIDGVTRAVTNVSETKTMVVQFDHNSERFTFELPRKIDDHDMSLCDKVRVRWQNTDRDGSITNSDYTDITDLQVSPDGDDVVICSWLIPDGATQLAGTLDFLLQFECTTNGVVDYRWSTVLHKGVSVSPGLYSEPETPVEPEPEPETPVVETCTIVLVVPGLNAETTINGSYTIWNGETCEAREWMTDADVTTEGNLTIYAAENVMCGSAFSVVSNTGNISTVVNAGDAVLYAEPLTGYETVFVFEASHEAGNFSRIQFE